MEIILTQIFLIEAVVNFEVMLKIRLQREITFIILFLFLFTLNKSDGIIIAAPDSPEIISPVDGSVINDVSPLFNWTDVPDVDMYQFLLLDSENSTQMSLYIPTSEYDYYEDLDDGDWSWTVRTNDSSGVWSEWAVEAVFAVDTIAPVILGSNDTEMNFGDTGNTISWIMNDLHPKTFTVFQNGLDFLSGGWSDGYEQVLILNNLPNGIHEFRIVVEDQAGNIAEDTIIVTVYPLIPEYEGMLSLLILSISSISISLVILKRK